MMPVDPIRSGSRPGRILSLGCFAALWLGVGAAAAQPAPPAASAFGPAGTKATFEAFSGSKYVLELDPVNLLSKNATDQPGNISGVWLAARAGLTAAQTAPSREFRDMDGKLIELTPWAAEIYNTRKANEAAGTPFAGTMGSCLPQGMPGMALNQPYPVQILQTPGQVTTIHELMHNHRLISLDAKLPANPDPTYMGTSVGHWEGDTLVVTTVGIRDNTTIGGGVPHSDQLRTVERIRRLDAETLEVVMTVEDPKAFVRPFKLRAVSKLLPPSGRPIEYICENQRNPVDEAGRSSAMVK